jgi:hypothetical protein
VISRRLQRVSHRLADQQSNRLRELTPPFFNATVSTVSAGQAADGNALVTVAGYAASYTPAVGHRVSCRTVDHQVQIDYRIVGYP